MTTEEAMAWFDSLPPATEAQMTGTWRGAGVPTGHALDGLLEASYWWGKRFEGVDAVHPLVHDLPLWGLRSLTPGRMPMGLLMRLPLRDGLLRAAIPVAAPLFFTRQPKARLRTMMHRGRAHAVMCYDDKPIHDIFATIDAATVLGWMEFKGMEAPFFFTLKRVG